MELTASSQNEPLDLEELAAREEEAVVRGLSSLAFLRSQGRTLLAQSQLTFVDFTWSDGYATLQLVQTQAQFDQTHNEWVSRLRSLLRTSRGGELRLGQGQKPLNVAPQCIVAWR